MDIANGAKFSSVMLATITKPYSTPRAILFNSALSVKMVNVKTPNKKRKSMANVEGQSPKAAKLDTPGKTPGKPKGNATPGKFNKTPKGPQKNFVKTPKGTPQGNAPKTPKQTPFKNQQASAKQANKKNKRSSESDESTPPKKLKMFGGTSELPDASPKKQKTKPQGQKQEQKVKTEGKKVKRKGQFFHLKQKVNSDEKEKALEELDKKIKAILERKELTKTAKRKLKLLQKLRSVSTGEAQPTVAPSDSKKRRERRKDTKVKQAEGGDQNKQLKAEVQKILKTEPTQELEEDSDSSESDYEVEAEIKPDKIIKTDAVEGEESEDEEESGEEEESEEEDDSEGEEEASDDDDDEEEDEKPAPPQKGGKKKGEERKNEVKTKNLKLQAMRKQGQLAGSVKESQKRSVRRAKKNVKQVNGS